MSANALSVFTRKGRLVKSPLGAQVVMNWQGRELLGDVVDVREERGYWKLTVRHFNGELWPVEPVLSAVRVLERTYDQEEDS
jgi:hypothetical protein